MKPLAFSPDGRFVAIGTRKKQELYELASGHRWEVVASGNPDYDAPVFSPDGRFLFPGGLPLIDQLSPRARGCSCYDLSKFPPNRLALESEDLVISPERCRYATIRGERGAGGQVIVSLHELPSLREIGQIEVAGLMEAGFTPGGRLARHIDWPA